MKQTASETGHPGRIHLLDQDSRLAVRKKGSCLAWQSKRLLRNTSDSAFYQKAQQLRSSLLPKHFGRGLSNLALQPNAIASAGRMLCGAYAQILSEKDGVLDGCKDVRQTAFSRT